MKSKSGNIIIENVIGNDCGGEEIYFRMLFSEFEINILGLINL